MPCSRLFQPKFIFSQKSLLITPIPVRSVPCFAPTMKKNHVYSYSLWKTPHMKWLWWNSNEIDTRSLSSNIPQYNLACLQKRFTNHPPSIPHCEIWFLGGIELQTFFRRYTVKRKHIHAYIRAFKTSEPAHYVKTAMLDADTQSMCLYYEPYLS